jgi:simple sugar transport system permease protein
VSEVLDAVFTVSLLAGMVRIATPVLFAAVGELVTERSGIMNLGIEGMMLSGAFAGFLTAHESGSRWLGVLAAIGAGALVALLFGFMTASLKLDQVVTALAINLLAAGLTFYLYRIAFQEQGSANLPTVSTFGELGIPGLEAIPVVGEVLFSQRTLTYLALLLVPVVALFLSRTRSGLEIRVIGENPRAGDMRGVNVAARQYAAVLFGGAMAGLGGAYLSLGSAGLFLPNMSAGRGFIAFALVIVGNWSAWKILAGALFFGLIEQLQLNLQAEGADVPHQLLLALPYLLTILVLVGFRRRSNAPLALGRPYLRQG